MKRIILPLIILSLILLFSCSIVETNKTKLNNEDIEKIDINSGREVSNIPADSTKTQTPNKADTHKERVSTKTQCKATTKKGTRCTRMTDDPSGYCFQHK